MENIFFENIALLFSYYRQDLAGTKATNSFPLKAQQKDLWIKSVKEIFHIGEKKTNCLEKFNVAVIKDKS